MTNALVRIDGRAITDWESFHDEFQRVLGFPTFYGRNMDAWNDCMTSVDCPEDGLTSVHVAPGQVLTIHVEHARWMKSHAREQYDALVECAAFVNWRRIEQGDAPVLALSFHV